MMSKEILFGQFGKLMLPILYTKRLILRPWQESDLVPFAAYNADPQVMEFYTHPLSRTESNSLAQKFQEHIHKHGYGFWAVEAPGVADFIGYIGLNYWNLDRSFAPCVDVGWRLGTPYWSNGYATEGALETLRYGFYHLQLSEIVSMATVKNIRSQRVMKRLGMTISETFEHPKLPIGHPLSQRVLYRLTRKEWFTKESQLQNPSCVRVL